MDKSSIKMQRCQLKRTLEACCHVFKDTELHLLSDYCTVNDMLNILMEYEVEKRRKREIDYEDYLVDDPEGQGAESDYLLQSAPMFISPDNPMLEEEGLMYVEPHFEDDSPLVGSYLGAPLPDRIKQEVLHHVTLAPVGDLMPYAGFQIQEREHPTFEAWREEQDSPGQHFDNFQKADGPIFGNNVEFMKEELNHQLSDTIFEETPEMIHSNFAHGKNAVRNIGLNQNSPDSVDIIGREVISNRGEDTVLEPYSKLPANVNHLQSHSKGDEDQVGNAQKSPLVNKFGEVVTENSQPILNHHSESTAEKVGSNFPTQWEENLQVGEPQKELLAINFDDGETDVENVNDDPKRKFITDQEHYRNFPVNAKPLQFHSREVEDVQIIGDPQKNPRVIRFGGVKVVSENSEANSDDHSDLKDTFQDEREENLQVGDTQKDFLATKFDEETVIDGLPDESFERKETFTADKVLTDFHKKENVQVGQVNDESAVNFQDSTDIDYNQLTNQPKMLRIPKIPLKNVTGRDEVSNLEQNESLVPAIGNMTFHENIDIEEPLEGVRENHDGFPKEGNDVQVGEPQHKKPLVSKFPAAEIIRINITEGPRGVPPLVNPGRDSPQTLITPSTKKNEKQMLNPVVISDADISDELDETLQLNQSSLEELLVGSSNLNNRGMEDFRAATSQDNDFRPKGKQLGALEDVQSTQQMLPNPCFYPYPSPYMPMMPNPSRIDSGYLKVLPSSQPRAQVLLNPAMFYSVPQPTSASYMYPQLAQSVHPPAEAPLQVSSPGGQYYVCNPIPTPASNIAGLAQVEVRREATSLQDLLFEGIDVGRG